MRAKIELIRVDNRLVHGQVGVTWVNALNIDTIVVVDDETAIFTKNDEDDCES